MSPDMEDRPDVLNEVTQRIQTGTGKVYVIINEDENGEPFDLFINIGSSGGYTNSWAEALAMTISVGLRSGADPEEIADKLMGNRGPQIATDNGDDIHSVPDAVGVALKRHIVDSVGESVKDSDEEAGMP